MELVYLWVEDYKNIHRQGFNFYPRFNCKYDPDTNELTIDKNDDYIENFFGDNINVTAIVGKNGSGKSSVLDLVIELKRSSSTDMRLFSVIMKDKKLILNYLNMSKPNIINDTNIPHILRPLSRFPKGGTTAGIESTDVALLNLAYVSLSPFLTNLNTLYNEIQLEQLISIYNYKNDYETKIFKYDDFFLSFVPKLPDLLDNEYINDLFEIENKPIYLTFKFSKEIYSKFKNNFDEIIKESEKFDESNTSLWYSVFLRKKEIIKKINILFFQIEDYRENLKDDYNSIQEKLKIDESRNLMPEIGDIAKNAAKMNKMTNIRINNKRKKLKESSDKINNSSNMNFFLNSVNYETFNFSTGELIVLFCIDKLVQFDKIKEDMTILIDENELFFHPNWQKKYISFVSNLFSTSKYKRQIIITSHSPFIISDIPSDNIIFMKNGKHLIETKKQTFGANIHTLLSDSFFMEDGLMGEFAKGKINEVIDFHKIVEKKRHKECLTKIYNKRKENFWNIQKIIGEEYLKQVIKNHLVEIEKILLGKDMAKKEEITRTKEYLKSLEDAQS